MAAATAEQPTKTPYEISQEKLRKRFDGDPEGIEISAPREPEVNPEAYKDVESLIFRGFLVSAAEINGVQFVFKSLNQHEFQWVQWINGSHAAAAHTSAFWNSFLAYGVFMVDGQNILTERERHIPTIAKLFGDFPVAARQKIIRNLSELNARATRNSLLTEAYATERNSRFRWAQLQGLDLCSPSVTGVMGSERLGLSWTQLLWRALNYFQDLYDDHEREWDNAKFVGSCFAGKGLSKIYAQDTSRRAKHKEDILAHKDTLLRHVLLGEPLEKGGKTLLGNAVMVVAKTADELAVQLQRDLRGEKDFHDSVVETWEQRVREENRKRTEHYETLAKQRDEEFQNHRVSGGSSLEGLTAAEVQERVLRRKQLEAQWAAKQMVDPRMDERLAQSVEKWGLDADAGPETVMDQGLPQTDQDPSSAISIPQGREFAKPFRRR